MLYIHFIKITAYLKIQQYGTNNENIDINFDVTANSNYQLNVFININNVIFKTQKQNQEIDNVILTLQKQQIKNSKKTNETNNRLKNTELKKYRLNCSKIVNTVNITLQNQIEEKEQGKNQSK